MRKSRGGGHGGAYVPAALKAALARASAQGKRLGRKPCAAPASRFEAVAHLSLTRRRMSCVSVHWVAGCQIA